VMIAPIVRRMIDETLRAIAAALSPKQREIISHGPESFREADAIPEGLFDHDLIYADGDETHIWMVTDLGRTIQELIDATDN